MGTGMSWIETILNQFNKMAVFKIMRAVSHALTRGHYPFRHIGDTPEIHEF